MYRPPPGERLSVAVTLCGVLLVLGAVAALLAIGVLTC